MGRLAVVVAGVAASAVAAAAVWTRRKAQLDAQAREAGVDVPAVPDPAEERERGLTPLPVEADASTETVPAPPEAPIEAPEADDLQTLKGIGTVSQERLAEQGVTTFAQIAAWSTDDLERIAAAIAVSPQRIRREDWVGQAKKAGADD